MQKNSIDGIAFRLTERNMGMSPATVVSAHIFKLNNLKATNPQNAFVYFSTNIQQRQAVAHLIKNIVLFYESNGTTYYYLADVNFTTCYPNKSVPKDDALHSPQIFVGQPRRAFYAITSIQPVSLAQLSSYQYQRNDTGNFEPLSTTLVRARFTKAYFSF